MSKTNKYCLISLLVIGGFFFQNRIIQAATLSVSPSSANHEVGDTFQVKINLDTINQSADGVDIASLKYNSNLLEVTKITAGSLFANTNINTWSNGQILFSQTSSGGISFSGVGVLAFIDLKAKASGTANLTFDYIAGSTTDCNVASNGLDILNGVVNGSYNIITSGGSYTTTSISTIPNGDDNSGISGSSGSSPSSPNQTPTVERKDQVKTLYQNILGRTPNANEISYWANTSYSLNDIRRYFFNSYEYENKISNLEKQKSKKVGIERLFQDIFGRPIKKIDLDWWLKRDTNVLGIKFNFMNSGEYKARLEDKQTTQRRNDLASLYRNILRRPPDAVGLNYWNQTNLSTKKIREKMIDSAEFSILSKNLERQRGRGSAFEHLFESIFNAAADTTSYRDYVTRVKGGSLEKVKQTLMKSERYRRQTW